MLRRQNQSSARHHPQRQPIRRKRQRHIIVLEPLPGLPRHPVAPKEVVQEYLALHLGKMQSQALVGAAAEGDVLEKVLFVLGPGV